MAASSQDDGDAASGNSRFMTMVDQVARNVPDDENEFAVKVCTLMQTPPDA